MIAVSIETGLLREVDAYAKSHKVKRTQLIARGLRKILDEGSAGKPRRRKSA
jgi:metal-responsive CopG/Arc/MetJ family transcriptional regulator